MGMNDANSLSHTKWKCKYHKERFLYALGNAQSAREVFRLDPALGGVVAAVGAAGDILGSLLLFVDACCRSLMGAIPRTNAKNKKGKLATGQRRPTYGGWLTMHCQPNHLT
jgi:hypothetical protein